MPGPAPDLAVSAPVAVITGHRAGGRVLDRFAGHQGAVGVIEATGGPERCGSFRELREPRGRVSARGRQTEGGKPLL